MSLPTAVLDGRAQNGDVLEPEDVEQLLAAMATAGRSRRTIVRVRSHLGQALAVAERPGKVGRSVARLAELPATAGPVEKQSLTADEEELR